MDNGGSSRRMVRDKRILIIGGVAAGTSAARRVDPDADIKIIQEELVISYGA
jgi:molybdopterin-guanine dinucleotide biosynthesis protein A